jgi:hypothetical protein
MSNRQQYKVGINANSLMIRHLRLDGAVDKNHSLIVQEIDQNVKDNTKHEPWSCHMRPSAGTPFIKQRR